MYTIIAQIIQAIGSHWLNTALVLGWCVLIADALWSRIRRAQHLARQRDRLRKLQHPPVIEWRRYRGESELFKACQATDNESNPSGRLMLLLAVNGAVFDVSAYVRSDTI